MSHVNFKPSWIDIKWSFKFLLDKSSTSQKLHLNLILLASWVIMCFFRLLEFFETCSHLSHFLDILFVFVFICSIVVALTSFLRLTDWLTKRTTLLESEGATKPNHCMKIREDTYVGYFHQNTVWNFCKK